MLGASDVLVKIVAASHCDVLTMLSFRSVIGLAFMAVWLRLGGAPVPANVRVRWISIGIGVLLTVLLYCLFEAIDLNDVIDRSAHLFRLSAAHGDRGCRDRP